MDGFEIKREKTDAGHNNRWLLDVCLSHRYQSDNLLRILSVSIMSNNGAVWFSNTTAFIVKLFHLKRMEMHISVLKRISIFLFIRGKWPYHTAGCNGAPTIGR